MQQVEVGLKKYGHRSRKELLQHHVQHNSQKMVLKQQRHLSLLLKQRIDCYINDFYHCTVSFGFLPLESQHAHVSRLEFVIRIILQPLICHGTYPFLSFQNLFLKFKNISKFFNLISFLFPLSFCYKLGISFHFQYFNCTDTNC